MWAWLHRLASPKYFYDFTGRLLPWLCFITLILFGYGLIGGLWLAPPDYQQGDAYRIIYIHVPSAFLSLLVYVTMAMAAMVSTVWQIKLADIVVTESAPLGAWFTVLALLTGAIWGKPMWGTWWIWDARLTSELILLFLYWGIIALRQSIPDKNTAARASTLLLLVGVVNVPIIHYSVYWWSTLHQGATLSLIGPEKIAPPMLRPLLAMIAAFIAYYVLVLFLRMRITILEREKKSQWVRQLISK